jgi:MYXO-CTERM domain-containing protein
MTLASARAWANGAFPDSLRIFVPADRPSEIVLVTNFGLVTTTDGGATWDWVCEHGDGYLAYLYQRAAPPGRRLFAVAPAGLVSSDDGGCSWTVAADLGATAVTDVFADPVDPDRVLVLGAFVDAAAEARNALFVSTDGGATYGAPVYVSPPDWTLASVETAAADPRRIYLTAYHATAGVATTRILRSGDGGQTFAELDVSAAVGNRVVRIAAVDPVDPDKLYLRLTGTGGSDDAIAVSADAGANVTVTLMAGGLLTALIPRGNGEILVSALDLVGGTLYRSTDGGAAFSPLPATLGIRAMAERGGTLYVAADDVADGFALGASIDGGATFEPVLRFDQVSGVRRCGTLATACAATCEMLVRLQTFAASACPAASADGGAGPAVPSEDAGCSCAVVRETPNAAVLATGVLLVTLRRRRRR